MFAWARSSLRINFSKRKLLGLVLVVFAAMLFRLILGSTSFSFPHLRGKVFVVTGADTSLGREIASSLLEQNATLVVSCLKLRDCEREAKQLSRYHPLSTIYPVEADFTSFESISLFAGEIRSLRLSIHSIVLYTDAYHGMFNFKTTDGINSFYGEWNQNLVSKWLFMHSLQLSAMLQRFD